MRDGVTSWRRPHTLSCACVRACVCVCVCVCMRLVAASLAATAAAVYLVRRRRRRWSVVAFYLLHEADVDELPLLEAAAASLSPGVTLSWDTEMSRAPPEATVFVARLPSAEALDSLKRLRAVIVPFAGPTVTTRLLLRARPHLSLHNAHFNAQSTSELAVGLLLAAAKGVLARDARLRAESRGDQPWTAGWAVGGTSAPPPTLGGRTALVLGYGAVGGRVAKALQGLGMHVLACRRSAARPHFDGVATVHPSADLDALLRRAFVLVVCLPGTADTEARQPRDCAAAALRPPTAATLPRLSRRWSARGSSRCSRWARCSSTSAAAAWWRRRRSTPR